MKAWYFNSKDRKLRYGDNRIIKAGLTHKVTRKPVLCNAGLHGSKRIIDALSYAPGPIVWRVELGGEMAIGDDKISATERHYLWGYDATDVLRRFARKCALDVIHLWDAPDVVIQYLKTGDENLRAAARDAAWAVARDAARAAAWAVARDAAWDAARAAAWAAAWDAARAAAWAAAWAAATKKQNNRLTQLIINNRPEAYFKYKS